MKSAKKSSQNRSHSNFFTASSDLLKVLIQATFSNSRSGNITKVQIRPVEVQGKKVFQITEFKGNQTFHKNLSASECLKTMKELTVNFKQGLLQTVDKDYQLLTNKKGNTHVVENPPSQKLKVISHNRPKNYILQEGTPIPFLIKLGLMNQEGKVLPAKMDKFKQINRFLEMVHDVLPALDTKRKIHIVDFGCGKAYLTFALYHYLNEIQGLQVALTGVDIKKSVIEDCQKLAVQCGYKHLQFYVGKIQDFVPQEEVNMLVALHACDTATDDALAQGLKWKVQVMLAAPCCQHELYEQMKSEGLDAILKHGILKERFASLTTDAVRSALLEMQGYKTQILEFIDSEHTPKNLLIRALRGNTAEAKTKASIQYKRLKEAFHIRPKLEELIPQLHS